MKKTLSETPAASPLSRRTLFAGAGAAGALAAAATLLPKSAVPVAAAVPATVTTATPAAQGGYQLTEHEQRYYQTARV